MQGLKLRAPVDLIGIKGSVTIVDNLDTSDFFHLNITMNGAKKIAYLPIV